MKILFTRLHIMEISSTTGMAALVTFAPCLTCRATFSFVCKECNMWNALSLFHFLYHWSLIMDESIYIDSDNNPITSSFSRVKKTNCLRSRGPSPKLNPQKMTSRNLRILRRSSPRPSLCSPSRLHQSLFAIYSQPIIGPLCAPPLCMFYRRHFAG